MERVSFEVAKYLKEVGYPQDIEEENAEGYAISDVRYQEYDSFDESWDWHTAHQGTNLIFATNYFYPEDCGEYCVAPYVMEAWFWLWREKGIRIKDTYDGAVWVWGDKIKSPIYIEVQTKDPEESIKRAIAYLVTNNLIE